MSDLLPVTQADRDAVQAFHRTMAARLMSDIASERPTLGKDEGDAGTLVQAFARHRLAALDSRAGDAGEGFIVKLDNWMTVSVEDGGLILRNEAGEPIAFGKLGPDAKLPATAAPEPFGYWVEHKHADPVLLRKPAYIPEPSDLRTVTPLYAAPAVDAVPAGEEWPKIVRDMLDGVKGARDRARAALSHGEGRK